MLPSNAIAASPPALDTALLKPDAVAACSASTEVNTRVVIGASARLIPVATRRTAGKTSRQYCASTPILTADRHPSPAMSAPATTGRLRPKREHRMLAIGETIVIRICSGMKARPATKELKLAPLIMTNGIGVKFAANAP